LREGATNGTGASEDGKGADNTDIDVAKLAVAAIGVVTAAAGLIGGFTGGIARVARNGPGELPWDVALVFAAAAAALIAALVPAAGWRTWTVLRGVLLVVALGLFESPRSRWRMLSPSRWLSRTVR
jgi:hypothetical protein